MKRLVLIFMGIFFSFSRKNTLVEYLSNQGGKRSAKRTKSTGKLWNLLRPFPLFAQVLEPAEFIHFGTTAEYRDLLLSGADLFGDLGWKKKSKDIEREME